MNSSVHILFRCILVYCWFEMNSFDKFTNKFGFIIIIYISNIQVHIQIKCVSKYLLYYLYILSSTQLTK
jgi:hypothetical protein